MDYDLMLRVADSYIEAVNSYLWALHHNTGRDEEGHRQEALVILPSAQAVARVVRNAPDPVELEPDDDFGFRQSLDAGLKLRGAILAQRDLAAALEPEGPELTSAGLHEWVREAASSLWAGGHYRQAVHAAAVVVDEHLKAALGRDDISGAALARQAFSSEDPKEEQPRLRFGWIAPGSETFRSVHDGARDFGAGCAQVIRNTAAHQSKQLEEGVAVEQLAVLSYWARLIASATRVSVDD